ncbi:MULTISPECIES: flagellar protein FlaG [Metabacillus]|uniref:Flagellar biosynthesis protein FlaG n=2 Tax=Metabacillus TaxID=2675233 RepID=A0A179SW18_9BACI|nr:MULTISPECIES: flagellar protein FlaG [Metabacillus]OAS85815.1 flagellar biosynthesis protein FlaG [Metabacillus litoralis]QNF27197.1 flagellar protein FlaG [Metabacillus sp. KUDC1714]
MSVEKLSSQPALHNFETTKPTGQNETIEPNIIAKQNIQEKSPSKEEMERVIDGINEVLQPANTHIKFELHEKLNEYYVTVVDNNTNEIVREIPSKKWLDIYTAMTDFVGLIVDKKI